MMLQDNAVLCAKNVNAVRRLLEQRKDGSVLYTCSRNGCSEHEEVRLLEINSQRDTLIYVNRSGSEIVNASLSPDAQVIAFTTLRLQNSHDANSRVCESQDQEEVLLDSDESDSESTEDENDDLVNAQNWQFNANESPDGNAKSATETLCTRESSTQVLKGKYSSYIADVYPTKWTKKFDINQSLYQKVIFTDCNIVKITNGIKIKEIRLLFVMHRKYIGLYSILLKSSINETATKVSTSGISANWAMYCSPRSVVIATKPLWSQWDGLNQRLYFVTVSQAKSTKDASTSKYPYSTTLFCEQFIPSDAWTRQVFSCKVNLCIKRDVISKKTSEYFLAEMDPTVSSRDINMKIMDLREGGLCLAWQTLFYSADQDQSLYKLALLHKDLVLTCSRSEKLEYEKGTLQERLSFSSHGNNVFVIMHGQKSFTHYLATDCIFGKDGQCNYHCHFLSQRSYFTAMKTVQQLPYSIEIGEDFLNGIGCADPIFSWDAISKSIDILWLDEERIRKQCFDPAVPIENKLAAARFGSLTFEHFSGAENVLKEFLSTDMILNGDKFLGTFLIQVVMTEVGKRFPRYLFLLTLLPVAIQQVVQETRDFMLSVKCSEIKEDIRSQISIMAEEDDRISQLWDSTLQAFTCGQYVPYNLQAIDKDIKIMEMQNNEMQAELNEIYETEISKPAQNEGRKSMFDCFFSYEQDHSRENLVTLTYLKLYDHLNQYLKDDMLAKRVARNFVTEQQRAVDHFMNLFIFLTIEDDRDKSLLTPVNDQERQLLHLLKRILRTCVNMNFPLPTGLQTRLTCLTFRQCVTAHLAKEDDIDADSEEIIESSSLNSACHAKLTTCSSAADIDGFSFEFFQLVDMKCVHVTGEFVAKLLEDLPDHEAFGGFIQQVLCRANFQSENISDGMLELWRHHYALRSLAKNAMEKLAHAADFDTIRKTLMLSRRRRSTMPPIEPSHFKPMDVFLNDVRRCSEALDVRITSVEIATLQGIVRKHGKENLRHIAH